MNDDLSPTGVRAYFVYCQHIPPKKVLNYTSHDNVERFEK